MSVEFTSQDRSILRRLASERSEIAASPANRVRADMWQRLNDLDSVKAMIWINEIPWHEMNVDDELTLQTHHPFCQELERQLRRELYQWRHMQGDMVIESALPCPLVVQDSGFGIDEVVDIATTDEASDVVSRRFHLQIREEADLEKIQMPRVSLDRETTDRNYEAMQDLFGDILPVVKKGAPGFWFAPWDELIRWWGVQEAMMDLVLRPELVHQAMDRLVTAYLTRLAQYQEQGLLSLNNTNVRIGSGGYGYTGQLPLIDNDPLCVRPSDLWGSGTAQIFSDVSPEMHFEFALQYERRWMDQFGLIYYGCCEPLHLKVEMLSALPNLRKISMSPWVDLEVAAEEVGGRYVFSSKPNPAIFAGEIFNPQRARDDLVEVLDKARGCHIEFIMKDISTVRNEPQRLWEWAEIAKQITEAYV